MKKNLSILMLLFILLATPALAADEPTDAAADPDETTAADLGDSETEINNATEEETQNIEETGMLIEIGNTTAEETTVIVRVTDGEGNTEDKTLEIDQTEVDLETNDATAADLSDWIAGDQLTYTATENTNNGSIKATRVRNRSFRREYRGQNGWITEIRPEQNEVDVTWNNEIYTLNLAETRLVAGLKNPASITDLQVGDRVRARVIEDGDGNDKTWNAKILVVLRRGKSLFMRVTRWVVPGKITQIDENPEIPATMTIEILASRFYQEGDVNNLIGAPGETLEVYIDENTKLRRRYFGKCLISEFVEGDRVQVIGRLNEGTGQLDAKFVRNANIQQLGVARRIAVVKSVDLANDQIIATTARTDKEWRIDLTADAEIYKQGEQITLEQVQVNDRLRVRGTANRRLKVVTVTRVVVLPTATGEVSQ